MAEGRKPGRLSPEQLIHKQVRMKKSKTVKTTKELDLHIPAGTTLLIVKVEGTKYLVTTTPELGRCPPFWIEESEVNLIGF